jgi:hypothetical protein
MSLSDFIRLSVRKKYGKHEHAMIAILTLILTHTLTLARSLPYLLNNEEVDRLGAEWRIYQLADILEDWIKTSTNSSNNITEYVPIDKYWYHVMSTVTIIGTPQYLVLTKLVKYVLSLSHSNSDVERGFSQINHLVSDDRSSLSEASTTGHKCW